MNVGATASRMAQFMACLANLVCEAHRIGLEKIVVVCIWRRGTLHKGKRPAASSALSSGCLCGRLSTGQIAGARSMEQRRSSQGFKRKELVGKLNPVCLRAFKAAADSAKL